VPSPTATLRTVIRDREVRLDPSCSLPFIFASTFDDGDGAAQARDRSLSAVPRKKAARRHTRRLGSRRGAAELATNAARGHGLTSTGMAGLSAGGPYAPVVMHRRRGADVRARRCSYRASAAVRPTQRRLRMERPELDLRDDLNHLLSPLSNVIRSRDVLKGQRERRKPRAPLSRAGNDADHPNKRP
jgi:hypothetical protein